MICPKCSYEQDARLDCLRCGIVFSKYSARNGDKPVSSIQYEPPDDLSPATLVELRQELGDLSRRFHEVEFERAERGQLRGELRTLDRKIESTFGEASTRLEAIERKVNEPPPPPPAFHLGEQPGLEGEIQKLIMEPLLQRLAELECRVQKLEESVRQFSQQKEDEQPHLPLEVDVHAIRQNLDQIRVFVTQLASAP